MKLYVWTDWSPDWTGGLAFAIAESEEQARAMVIAASYDAYDWGLLTVYELDSPIAFAVVGGS